jgi:formiminoglutamase
MLQNWLKPLPKTLLNTAKTLPEHCLGRHVALFDGELPNLQNARVALLGADETSANAVRPALYRAAYPWPAGSVVDLGNLRKAGAAQLIPVLYELLTGGLLPVVIGRQHDLARAQFLAYQEAKTLANWAVVDETIRVEEVVGAVLEPRHPLLFHLAHLGGQSFHLPEKAVQLLEDHNCEVVRLGKSRSAIEETEPVIRDADLLTFHLNALKMSDLPAVASATPSGYFLEEACQLARYAGMSDKLTSFGIYGFEPDRDRDEQSAQAVAQLVWYFLDGFFNRTGDYPLSTKGLTEYVVELPALSYQLTFWKSKFSGRWWLQVPVTTQRKHQRHRLIPCSLQDYQAACREELPERLLNAFKRF